MEKESSNVYYEVEYKYPSLEFICKEIKASPDAYGRVWLSTNHLFSSDPDDSMCFRMSGNSDLLEPTVRQFKTLEEAKAACKELLDRKEKQLRAKLEELEKVRQLTDAAEGKF